MPTENAAADADYDEDLTPEAKADLESGAITNEDDDEEYGKRVQKRIAKEVKRRKEEEGARRQAETEAQRLKRELEEAKGRLSKYQEREDEGLTTKAEDLKKRRAAALDDGDLAAYNDLNDELLEIRIEMRDRSRNKAEKPPADEHKEEAAQMSRAASSWVSNNQDWLNADQDKTRTAARIERQLVAEGYSVNDSDLYEELDRRLAGYGNDDEVQDDDEVGAEAPPAKRQGATAGVPRDQGSKTPAGKNRALTTGDLRKMSQAGFDPDNPEHRKAWKNRNNPL